MKKISIFSFFLLFFISHNYLAAAVANPFGSNVIIFEPSMSADSINNTILQKYNQQRFNEFGEQRYTFLFMPGQYGKDKNVDVRVGYYTQILGAGNTPNDVVITGAVRTQDAPPGDPNHPEQGPGCLTNFWRGCENLAVIPTLGSLSYPDAVPKDQNVWAVSQAAPLRRLRVMNGSLRLYDLGYSSGGFLADSRIDKQVISGTQQQWLTRNTALGSWVGSNWNIVFTGVFGSIPKGNWPNPPYTITEKTPVIKEKPYVYYDSKTQNFAVKARTLRKNVAGTDWHIAGTSIPLSKFFIAKPGVTAGELNAALNQKQHLLFTPGVYYLDDTIKVNNPNTIIFGMGFPSLVTNTAKPALVVSDVDGVQVAGLLFDAGPVFAPVLFQVGESKTGKSHAKNPIFLFDVFFRVGGVNHASQSDVCLIVNSNDVVADNLWIWRADHGSNVGWTNNRANTGIVVNGDNMTIYGLMVEHFQKYQTIWNGENGLVHHYQSEAPYDVPNQSAWKNGQVNGYASYKIADSVNTHKALAMGIYSFFRDSDVILDSAIEAPVNKQISLSHMILFWLSGRGGSAIKHVVNNVGGPVTNNQRRFDLVSWP